MTDYIKREDAVNAVADMLCFDAQPQTAGTCTRLDFIDDAKDWIDECQSADVAPVRHGRWMPLTDCSNEGIYCSECHKKVYRAEYSNTMKMHSPYCPNCGAKMDEEETKE